MTGRFLLLAALFSLILTQATFAKENRKDAETKKDESGAVDAKSHLKETEEDKASEFLGDPSIVKSAKKMVGEIIDGFDTMLLGKGVDEYIAPSSTDGGFDDKDAEASEELRKKYPPVKTNQTLPTEYPPPVLKENPVVTQWSLPKPSTKKSGRKIKSYTISGNDVKFNSPDSSSKDIGASDESHVRVKRSHLGVGIPDEFEFTLESLAPFDTSAVFKIGSVIPYRLTIHANNIETDVKVEIFSELNGGAYFMVSNVRLGSIGSNIDPNFDSSAVVIQYNSKFNDGRWDYATADLGNILNSATDTTNEAASQIEIEFEMQALVHDSFVVDETYRVSVGAMYQAETYVTVAQDDLIFADYTPQSSPVDATFSITGPDTLSLGVTGVWEIEAAVHDLYSDIALDVLAPLHSVGVMSIDNIAVTSVGENYMYAAVSFGDGSNFTRMTYENYGNYGRLNLGTIINAGYHSADNDLAKNTIKFEVSITMLDHAFNETDPYVVGFTIWKKDMDSVEIMWSAQQGVQAENTTLPALASSPTFTWRPSADTVIVGGRFAVVMNMSVPSSSSARYNLEASVPVNDSTAMMEIERVRISRNGFNLPHVAIWEETAPAVVTEKTDGTSVDFISWDLGIITNTGQRSGTDDQIIQFEIMIKVLSDATTHYSEGDNMYISLGMKHADDYYWVGRTSIVLTETPLQFNGEQVPEFSFVNVMGADAVIAPDAAAVYDMDMILPASVDYPNFLMEISTTNFTTDSSTTKLRIISMEIVHVGRAIYCDEIQPVNLTYQTPELDSADRMIYTVGVIEMGRVTSLRDENFGRYSYEDSTIRIRTIVIARSSTAAGLQPEITYWTETTVSFADSYIYAARAGVIYNNPAPSWYAVQNDVTPWQPVLLFELPEGGTSVVAPGTPIIYNITVGLPYRTTADVFVKILETANVDAIQICRVRHLSSGAAIVPYVSRTDKGDIENTTDNVDRDLAYHRKSMVTSFSYDNYVGDVTDSYLSYEAIVLLNDKATIGSSYTFEGLISMFYGQHEITPTLSIDATDVAPASNLLPEVYIGKLTNNTNNIHIGGSELYYLDIYVVPGTQHYLVVNVLAPWNETYYGEYELLEVYVVSHGINLACYDNARTAINVTRSSDNNSGKDNLAIITLGYVPSVAEAGSELEIEENKLRIVAHVALSRETTLSAGDQIPIAGTIDINGEHLWVGYIDSDVATAEDDSSDEAGNVTLEILPDSDSIYNIGEIQHYNAILTVPPGTAYADFHIDLDSQIDVGESRVKIFDVNYIGSGMNLLELKHDIIIIATENEFGVEDMQRIDFKFIRNTNISEISSYITPVNESSSPTIFLDNKLHFNFSIQLLDTIELIDGYEFDIDAVITPGANDDIPDISKINITVVSPPEDNAILDWNVEIYDQPLTVYQNSVVTFKLDVLLNPSAQRFPSNVVMHFRVPHFSLLESVFNTSVIASQFTEPTQVEQFGLDFTWSKIRWENYNYMKFNITVDPTYTMEPGLGSRVVSIPVDISYQRENRTNPNTFDGWYTEMRVLTFNIEIPDNIDALGMSNGDIGDCQISASSDDGTNVPENARYGRVGWSMAEDKGPPFYQNEYIQVDMGAYVKFSGVTLYAFNSTGFSRITSFKVQYSRKGIRWVDAVDTNRDVKTFGVTWPTDPDDTTAVFVPFELSSFIAQYIRIIPQANSDNSYTSKMRFELHGYSYPYGTSLPSYTCPSVPALKPYELRQILAVPGTNEMYACTIPGPGKLPYCSGTNDFGASWFAMDDNVLNVYGHDSETAALYGLARDRTACLRSKDQGHSWKAIACGIYDGINSASTYAESKEIPFPLDGSDSASLFTNYGTEIDATHSWSVSAKALHAYPADEAGVGSKTADENQVAYWGNKVWSGP